MAKKTLGAVPFPPLERVATNVPLTEAEIQALLEPRPDGVSICIRSVEGHVNRGGYYFHIVAGKTSFTECKVYSFEKTLVATLALAELTAFINHCSGLEFDELSFQLCQQQINFRLDPEDEVVDQQEEDDAGDA